MRLDLCNLKLIKQTSVALRMFHFITFTSVFCLLAIVRSVTNYKLQTNPTLMPGVKYE